ncbi:conserved hypothetical protein [Mesotoga infera]|nr:conserved hypothetical protein [Mesotoga infera]
MSDAIIYTYSVIDVPTAEFVGKTPYAVALVEREDGSRVLTRILNYTTATKLEIGMRVLESGQDEKGNLLYSIP